MVYIKIFLALLVWGLLFFYGGSSWLEKKSEQTCESEIEKDKPNLEIINKRCLQTAEVYMENEEYGSAAWFYLLAGKYEKNIDEVETKITDDFYMNIGHSYLLKGNYEKAKEIYTDYPWEGGLNFRYSDEGMQHDFVTLPKLYSDKKENIAKGLAIWNEIYEPIGKIVEASNAYNMAEEDDNGKNQIKFLEEYLKYAKPYKEKSSIHYLSKKKVLAELYSSEYLEKESIAVYEELASFYETNSSNRYAYIDTILSIADEYTYIPDYNSSLAYYKKALSLTLDTNNSDEQPLDLDVIYSTIASNYSNMNNAKEAINYYNLSVKHKDANDYGGLSDIYAHIANINFTQKDYNASIENYGKSIVLKKEELKNSEDYDREDVFYALRILYSDLAKKYETLNMNEKSRKTYEEYVSFLEYEYENHYKVIASACDSMAENEKDANLSLKAELKAIKFSKKSVEKEWGSSQEENNENLYKYMNGLEDYLSRLDTNESRSAKAYLPYVKSFQTFQEKVFIGEENNTRLLAKSYDFESQAYDKASDMNKSKIYAHKAVEFMKKNIEEDTENSTYHDIDDYYYHLWSLHYRSNLDVKSLINDYLIFKKKYYKDDSEVLISAYQSVGNFYYAKSAKSSIVYYNKALDEALINNQDNTNSYYIKRNIKNLRMLYTNSKNFEKKESLELMNKLIDWQEKNYGNKFVLGKSHISLGDIYAENNESSMFVAEYHKSIVLFMNYNKENNSSLSGIYALKTSSKKLATYYIKHNKKEEAIAIMQAFIKHVEKVFSHDNEVLSMSYNLFADIYALTGDEKNSKKNRVKASKLSDAS